MIAVFSFTATSTATVTAATTLFRSSSVSGDSSLFFNGRLGFRSELSISNRKLNSSLSANMEFIRRFRVTGGCFKGSSVVSNSLKIEADSGGEDFFNAEANSAQSQSVPEHLVIMVNGLIGSAADWRYAAEQFVKKLPDKVIVHRSECNSSKLTFDGVDTMGERLADEVLSVTTRWPQVRKISFVAHSLGGLIARYAIGRLYSCPTLECTGDSGNCSSKQCNGSSNEGLEQPHEARVAGLIPINFITVATPHLGSRGHKQLPFLCGLPFLEKRATQTAHLVAGRTGKHLFLNDSDDGKPPLLLRMVNDFDNLKFMSSLRAFKRRVAYANANYDHMVGWRTSSIRRQDELPKSNLLVTDYRYPHIVYIERESAEGINKRTTVVNNQKYDLEEEMIRGLTQVPWERVDVSFQKSKQRFIAHSTIQVKTYWLNSDGADVVCHMIDNFLL